ncbi:hypothetical protein VFPPC_15480 [Pochonia chlamydosporia 170]|uniref:Uncharacterized protein n=1 Tax=Pochonia chlamydosporia 170 TaxID=1380566 RepID=A0A179FVX0_METCM|nr:hypothetical protein VFPPC_15480 [Pochonia chlamydosporia 170]OAQ69764.2 hypothetical protein VFPPC_15480 [Pochonia chlamydosporia 170]
MHLLPQPALRLLLHPPAHPVPHILQLVRPMLLRLPEQLVPPAAEHLRARALLQRDHARNGELDGQSCRGRGGRWDICYERRVDGSGGRVAAHVVGEEGVEDRLYGCVYSVVMVGGLSV